MKVTKFKKDEVEAFSVSFTDSQDVWEWNEAKKMPVKTGKINVHEVAQSCLQTTLDYILDRFLNGCDTQEPKPCYSSEFLSDELDRLSSIQEFKNECCQKYHLNENMSFNDLQQFLESMNKQIKEKGEKENEKTKLEKESTSIQENSQQNEQA